jgi:adenylate kinase
MVVSIIGGSGVGKDTQAKLLAVRFNLPHISTGQIIRDEAKAGNPIAIKASELADQGKWSKDEDVNALLRQYVTTNCANGFIITGYPRTAPQYQFLHELAKELNQKVVGFVHLTLSEKVMLERMRKQDQETTAAGNARPDTSEEALRNRIQSYKATISDILQLCEKDGLLREVPAEGTIDEVHNLIVSNLNLVKN